MGCGSSASSTAAAYSPGSKTLLESGAVANVAKPNANPAAQSMVNLFGEKLLTKKGEASTAEVLSGKKYIMLYFSAHWCPPCRAFTPQLAESYKAATNPGSETEVVFVSSDRDEKSFNEYYGSMPWLALPFSLVERKSELAQQFEVSGIPKLVVLDSEGKLVTGNGRSDYKSFLCTAPTVTPAPQPSSSALVQLLGEDLLTKEGMAKTAAVLAGKRHVMLYFSAHWCPPCRGFTPQLASAYRSSAKAGSETAVVFVSSDQNEGAFGEYYGEMPWVALPYAARDLKDALSQKFNVRGIPTLIVLNGEGALVTSNGRSEYKSYL